MNITIIGTGNVGSALGGSFGRAGHDVTYVARDRQKATAVAEATSGKIATSIADAVRSADAVVLAVPYRAVFDAARSIAPYAQDKLVIDTTNPLTPDYSGLATAGGPSVAEQLAEALPGARLVKGFNTTFASVQANASSAAEAPDALYATDDVDARSRFAALAESIGFRPVHVGPLAAARELEAVALLNIRLQLISDGSWNTTVKLVDPPARSIAA